MKRPRHDRRVLRVMAKRCDECLYTQNKIVSDSRRDEILARCATTETHFVCHKASNCGFDVMCRAHWEATKHTTLRNRLAIELGVVVEVSELELRKGTMGKNNRYYYLGRRTASGIELLEGTRRHNREDIIKLYASREDAAELVGFYINELDLGGSRKNRQQSWAEFLQALPGPLTEADHEAAKDAWRRGESAESWLARVGGRKPHEPI